MKNKKVSIVVPIYNSSKYLKTCLDSLICQTYKNIEIILVNDGSTDNSLNIMEEYKEKYSDNIKIINQENQGVAAARNNGLKQVSGYYLTFMDNDDYIEPDFIENFVKEINDNDILIGGYIRKTYDGKIVFKRKLKQSIIAPYIQLASWGKLYKTSFIKNNDLFFLNTKIADDFYFNIKAYNLTKKIKIVSDLKYYWMFNDSSLSNTDSKKMNRVDDLLETLNYLENNIEYQDIELKNYFYLRTIIYYILFSSKGCDYNIVINNYEKMFKWLKNINNNYKKNKYLKIFKDYGEIKKVKLIMIIFILLQNIKLDKLFLKLYI